MSDIILFEQHGDSFYPTAATGSFWGSKVLHGGAVAALLGHILQQQKLETNWRFNRISIDLIKPVQREPLSVSVECIRNGSRLKVFRVDIKNESELLVSGSVLAQKLTDIKRPENAPILSKLLPGPKSLDEINVDEFFRSQGFDQVEPGFNKYMYLRMISPWVLNGHGKVWMKVPVRVVEDEEMSPFVYACMFSDFGNGIGQIQLGKTGGIVNADIVMHLLHYPIGEWIGIDASTYMESDGIAVVRATFYDREGAFAFTQHASMPNIQI
jgi:acyl-CoA thioesterase